MGLGLGLGLGLRLGLGSGLGLGLRLGLGFGFGLEELGRSEAREQFGAVQPQPARAAGDNTRDVVW